MVVVHKGDALRDVGRLGTRQAGGGTAALIARRAIARERDEMLRKQFLETSRGRIAALLQRGGLTAEEMAAHLRLTTTAVRAQLAGMERDGLVRRAGQKRGVTRPSHVFELTA